MILGIIYNLKDIGAAHLLENKCQSYAEGVVSAWNAYNAIVMLVPWNDIENRDNNAEETFQTGMIDFYEFVLDNE